jgi:hypothetical protein
MIPNQPLLTNIDSSSLACLPELRLARRPFVVDHGSSPGRTALLQRALKEKHRCTTVYERAFQKLTEMFRHRTAYI